MSETFVFLFLSFSLSVCPWSRNICKPATEQCLVVYERVVIELSLQGGHLHYHELCVWEEWERGKGKIPRVMVLGEWG